jgi:hypothetical protein
MADSSYYTTSTNPLVWRDVSTSEPEIVTRRVLVYSGAVALALLLAIAAFFLFRGRVTPLWPARHTIQALAP